jgi:hypothetical protein
MYRVRRIGVISAANVAAAVAFVITLVFVLLVALVVLPMGSFPAGVDYPGPFDRMRMPSGSIIGFVVLVPLLYAAIGWVMGALTALVYNLVARFTGGLQLDLEQRMPPPPASWVAPGTSMPPAAPPATPYDPPREG